jgi:DNA-binding response OmpR family regulator
MARILIIDDDVEFCIFLQEILERAGYEVVVAHNGREGVACYEATSIDLVITDILMPQQEGLETITALQRLNPQVKIIAVSGGGQTGRMDFLYVATVLGVQRTLRKPFTRQELLEAVRALTQGEDEEGRPGP